MLIRIQRDPAEVAGAVEEVERLCLAEGIPPDVTFKLQLSVDEVLTNIISHGFEDAGHSPVITVDLRFEPDVVRVEVRDNGVPFNPLEDAEAPDLTLSAEDRPIGGLGIHLTKSFIHDLSYQRVEGFNCLTLTQPREAAQTDEPPKDTAT